MKKPILFLSFALTSFFAVAQDVPKIKVAETNVPLQQGSKDGFMVEVYVHKKDDLEDAFKHFLKQYDAKVSVKKEIFGDNAMIKDLSANFVDVYAVIEEKTKTSQNLMVAVDLGGAFLSKGQQKDQAQVFEKLLYEFAIKTSKETVLGEVKEAEKALSKQEKELEGLKSDKTDLEKNIKDYEEKITKAKGDIEKNTQMQADSEKKIAEQKEAVKLLQAKEKAVN